MIAWDLAVAPSVDVTRKRSLQDLIERIGLEHPARIIDLGCGSGLSSRMLAKRFPETRITAVDINPETLERARREGDADGRITFVDLRPDEWDTLGRADVVFSCGLFQKLPGHERIFPSLLKLLSPWGVFAVMMPRNVEGQPYERAAPAVRGLPWFDGTEHVGASVALAPAIRYSRILTPRVHKLDIWETVYHAVVKSQHPLEGAPNGQSEPIGLEAPRTRSDGIYDFLDEYIEQVRGVYQSDENGIIVYPLRHIFIVARNPVTQHI
ncbi:methyltransferase domain-containing protein [Phaeovibrio sulfidiphilus]|uniref:Methyltransferase domain-containing protein n=1 Tax=Phaeovibrio sulfidiphilus TaxID=1220600 RepID=A0A8J6YPW7_9PROT|nr:methyltransferase domain-containing protein [Phaeovibrio sulfidiphilus]MBE1237057.1 methyltransferase domain-containing protein [Phaeovibrio sulfidiphilus]